MANSIIKPVEQDALTKADYDRLAASIDHPWTWPPKVSAERRSSTWEERP